MAQVDGLIHVILTTGGGKQIVEIRAQCARLSGEGGMEGDWTWRENEALGLIVTGPDGTDYTFVRHLSTRNEESGVKTRVGVLGVSITR